MNITTVARTPEIVEHPLLIIERILRDREGIWQQIKTEHHLNRLIGQMLVSSAVALACYGAVLGLSNSVLQALSSAIKLPLLFLLTPAICLPTLYLFNLVFGARLSVRQALALILVAITVTATLTLAFAPISLFFLFSASSYQFFKLLNVSIMTLTGFVGLSFLVAGMRSMNTLAQAIASTPVSPASSGTAAKAVAGDQPKAPALPERPANMSLLNVWILLYGFVGTQLAWTLRPFFGDPNQAFQIFRSIGGSFYVNIVKTLVELFT